MQSLKYLHFLQIKNFRIDRIICFIKFESGLKKLFNKLSLVSFLLCLITAYYFFNSPYLSLAILLGLWNSKRIGLFRPKFTKKVLTIIALLACLHLAIASQISVILSYGLSLILCLGLILPLIPLNYLLKEYYIRAAKKKLLQFKDLKVIGVTGSFGKSSTKNFIQQFVSTQYRVLCTQGNLNTEIGIARMILKQLNPKHEVLILEMGAYKKGEIKKVLQMLPLDYAVLTAVSDQHLALFKNQANLLQAKAEIFSKLKPKAKILLNLEHIPKTIFEHIKTKHPVISFLKSNPDFQLLTRLPSLQIKIDSTHFKLKGFAPHLEANLYLAIKLALDLAISPKQIQKSLLTPSVCPNSMSLKGKHPQFILDTYNCTSRGVHTMLDIIQEHYPKQKKMLIFSGFQELGSITQATHDKLLQKAVQIFDQVLLTKSIARTFQDPKIHTLAGLKEQTLFIQEHCQQQDLVYVAGRQYQKITDLIDQYVS